MDVNEAVDRYLQGQTLNIEVRETLDRGSDENGREFFLLYSTLQRARNLKSVPEMLKRIVKQGTWKKWTWVGRTFEAQTLAEYLTRPIPKGLGADLNFIEKVISDDAEALAMFRQETTGEHGGDHKSNGVIKSDNITLDPKRGTSKAYTLERLKRERPDLFEKVVAKELSAACFSWRSLTLIGTAPSSSVLAESRSQIDDGKSSGLSDGISLMDQPRSERACQGPESKSMEYSQPRTYRQYAQSAAADSLAPETRGAWREQPCRMAS